MAVLLLCFPRQIADECVVLRPVLLYAIDSCCGRRKRQKKEADPIFGAKPSKAKPGAAFPERNAAIRAQAFAKRFTKALLLRADIAIDMSATTVYGGGGA